ncbi:2-oxo acid dehydrogenase subunit E2 [Parahaliea aestuarii]|uniref:Dihydrolipoamide acetyltransferase component of pyruvate dehydrogenase complex n=1 Tax=Parahaliea aestuarii TaxID=1852021 RepID=A0A5C9A2R2_9GAMM|nr:2-oxo acid dehydrogenase subunit E2 [Parahaliea aestuarii]TXS95048.1 2-oxo acid dehydrogenase subunit E2 [Parahaliea aestuarii]
MSQIQKVSMPKWGMEMTEGVIAEWHVAEGDAVNADDDLVDIETSKIVNTVTAPVSGVLRRILVEAGGEYPVGAALCVLADAETPDAEIDAFVSSLGVAPTAAPEPAPAPADDPAPAREVTQAQASSKPQLSSVPTAPAPANSGALQALAGGDDDSAVAATPVARRLAAQYGVNLHNISPTGRHERVTKADLEQAVVAAGGQVIGLPDPAASDTPRAAGDGDAAVAATPVARRMASELNINLLDCRASGTRGRVCKADVEARAALMAKTPANQPVSNGEAEPAAFEEQPLSGMRKTIAARLQSSKQTAPHFRVQVDATIDQLLALRKALNASRADAKISVNDFIIKAAACALTQVPAVNVQFDGETVRQFTDADISVAVALDEGLITPIVRKANRKGLVEISNEVRDLATRAKLGRLSAAEFQGGTFSISNLGMFGVKQFDAIINPPQGAILAIGAAEQRPLLVDGEWQAASVLTLSLSSDHRIIDGALAAKFLAALRGFLEQPGTMLG